MAATVIRNFIAKALFKKKGAIANNKSVDFSANALEERLRRVGIDPNAIQNENQLNEILAAVKQAEDQAFDARFGNMLGGSKFDKQADVLDMTGKKIDSRSKIMGGQQAETEAEILARINKENKKGIANIKNKMTEIDEAIDNASPGFAGDRKYDAQLVADDLADKRFGKDFYDLDQRQQMDLYDEAYTGLSKQRFKNKPDPEKKAVGGRIGYKDGPDVPGRRKFMKIMGGLATIPFVGKFFKGAKTAAPAVEKAAEVAGQAPSYFFDLVTKIKTLGRMSDGPADRVKVYSMKGQDGKSELMLTEDIGTGEMQIKKIGKENDEMVTDVQTMDYTPGSSLADETTKGIPADDYQEYTEVQSRIYKDEFNDPDIVEGINVEDIVKEVKDQTPSIKKADGGIAMMLGE